MLPLTKEEIRSNQDAKICYICGKRILTKFDNDRNYGKVREHCRFIEPQHVVFVI